MSSMNNDLYKYRYRIKMFRYKAYALHENLFPFLFVFGNLFHQSIFFDEYV